MTIAIKKKAQEEWAILGILMLPFAFFLLIDVFRLPSAVKYAIDIAWLFLLATIIINRFRVRKAAGKLLLWVGLFFLFTVVGLLLEYQSVLYYLWGFRNNARFFVLFFACVMFLKLDSAKRYMQIFDKVYLVNFVVSLFQFFIMNKRQDYLGGIFGVDKGCNAFTNVFLIIMTTWHAVLYMNGKEKIWTCMSRCIMALVIGALAELKFFFIEFIIAFFMVAMLTKFSMKKVWISIGALLMVAVGAELLATIFTGDIWWLNIERIWQAATSKSGYTNSGDMNRLTAVPIAWNRFLDTWPRKLFGLGLGNCDRADGFDFLTSPFYLAHKKLHYDWFSSSFMILETGAVGLGLYVLFFVQVFLSARKEEKKNSAEPEIFQLAKTMAVICPLLIIYDGSMRTEAAYIMYFVLALPFLKRSKLPEGKLSLPKK